MPDAPSPPHVPATADAARAESSAATIDLAGAESSAAAIDVAGAESSMVTELGAPADTFGGTVAADLAVAVSPSTGRFRPADLVSARLPAGALLGHVTGGGGRADEVRTPVTAHLRDVLVRPGQLVARGQPLAWLQRGAAQEPVDLERGWETGA